MDDHRFDSLIKMITASIDRRGVLAGLAGGGLSSLLGRLADDAVDAKKKNKKKKKCKGKKKKCRGKCISKSQCCNNSDCTGGGICQNGACQCPDGQQDCAGTCIPSTDCCTNADCGDCESCDNGACSAGCGAGEVCCDGQTCQECCTSADCDADPTTPICDNGVCVCAPDGETCASGATCCTGVCSCNGGKTNNPETDECHGDTFSQDFANNVDGWYDWDNQADTWPGGHSTIQQVDGHAVLAPGDAFAGDLTPMTLWGGYSSAFPSNGYNTELDIFLDPITADDSTHFHYSSAINKADCLYHTEAFFHGGTNEDGKFCVSGGGGVSNNPCDNGFDPVEINAADWYTFRHQFRVVSGNVKITMKLVRGSTVLGTWVTTGSNDPAGGNRYGWFPVNQFPALSIDNSTRT